MTLSVVWKGNIKKDGTKSMASEMKCRVIQAARIIHTHVTTDDNKQHRCAYSGFRWGKYQLTFH